MPDALALDQKTKFFVFQFYTLYSNHIQFQDMQQMAGVLLIHLFQMLVKISFGELFLTIILGMLSIH